MQTEWEATFYPIEKIAVRDNLRRIGASLMRDEYLQKRYAFRLPKEEKGRESWVRVRDEGGKITMSYKEILGTGSTMADQKEIYLQISDFEVGKSFLEAIGCTVKAFQESKREVWELDSVEICIDEWPFLEPFVEIEGSSEDSVKKIAIALGFDWSNVKFCTAGNLYAEKYGISSDFVNRHVDRIVFGGPNPFTTST